MTRKDAIQYLTQRYERICLKFPTTRETVSLEGYVSTNLPVVLKNARNRARRERDQMMRDLGMKKVRGNLGGTYWE